MRLTDLFPQFLREREMTPDEVNECGISGTPPFYLFEPVEDLSMATHLRFTNPQWASVHPGEDGSMIGMGVHIKLRGRGRDADERPSWEVSGTGYEDLRLSPSIFVNPHANPPGWHGFIGISVPGEVTTC